MAGCTAHLAPPSVAPSPLSSLCWASPPFASLLRRTSCLLLVVVLVDGSHRANEVGASLEPLKPVDNRPASFVEVSGRGNLLLKREEQTVPTVVGTITCCQIGCGYTSASERCVNQDLLRSRVSDIRATTKKALSLTEVKEETGADSSICQLYCQDQWAVESAIMQCANPALSGWFATSSTLTCGAPSGTWKGTPAACTDQAKNGSYPYASWRYNGSGGIGTCSFYGSKCAINFSRMQQRQKQRMSNTTEVLWRKVN